VVGQSLELEPQYFKTKQNKMKKSTPKLVEERNNRDQSGNKGETKTMQRIMNQQRVCPLKRSIRFKNP
jgi:hypothetical protein